MCTSHLGPRSYVFLMLFFMSDPLAYLTAKTNGLDDICNGNSRGSWIDGTDVTIYLHWSLYSEPPPIVTSTTQFLIGRRFSAGEKFSRQSLANGALEAVKMSPMSMVSMLLEQPHLQPSMRGRGRKRFTRT